MSILTQSAALDAIILRNKTLPPHYENCSLQLPSWNCWISVLPLFPVAIEMTATDPELRSAWTCQEIIDYCTQFESWRSDLDAMYKINSLGVYNPPKSTSTYFEKTVGGKVLAPIGLILNILLFITFCSKQLKGRVFWYLRAVALAQVFQAIEKISSEKDAGYSEVNFVTRDKSKSFIFVIFYGLTNLFPFFKQFAIAMGLFVASERFVSVFSEMKITKRIHKRYFFAAMACSILIGTLPLFCLYLVFPDEKSGKWTTDQSAGYQWYTIRMWIYNYLTTYTIVSFDIASIVLALTFTICINVKLSRRSRKIGTMMNNVSVKQEHKRMLDYARLQTLDTFALIIDLCSTLFSMLQWAIEKSIQRCTSRDCLFPSVVRRYMVTYQVSFQAAYLFEILSGFCHAELFFLYLIFSKKFRDAHIALWRAAYKKLKALLQS